MKDKSNFRSEVFKLCKVLENNEDAKAISSFINDLSVSVENKENGIYERDLHGDFAYLVKHSDNQFQGYLFVDDNMDTLNLPIHLKVEHLSKEERMLVEKGHVTLIRFINMCLEDLNKESELVANAISPYFLYKEVEYNKLIEPLLKNEELYPAVNAFKNGEVYKVLVKSKATNIFKKFDKSAMYDLIGTIEKDMNLSFGEDISQYLKEFSMKLMGQLDDVTDVIFAFSILIYALRESLRMACQILYEAICGDDLIVLNNDNIINIENYSSNGIYEKYKVLVQGSIFGIAGNNLGNVLLMDCDSMNESHIKEFGMVTEKTMNFASEMGETTKYTFITVNENLIHIHNIIDEIIRAGLPEVRIN